MILSHLLICSELLCSPGGSLSFISGCNGSHRRQPQRGTISCDGTPVLHPPPPLLLTVLLVLQVGNGMEPRDAWEVNGKPNGERGIQNIHKRGMKLRQKHRLC